MTIMITTMLEIIFIMQQNGVFCPLLSSVSFTQIIMPTLKIYIERTASLLGECYFFLQLFYYEASGGSLEEILSCEAVIVGGDSEENFIWTSRLPDMKNCVYVHIIRLCFCFLTNNILYLHTLPEISVHNVNNNTSNNS